MLMMSHQRRQHPDQHSLNNFPIQGLPLRNVANNSQFLSPVPSESEVARLSHSPLSTLESSPTISNLEFNESADYYMPRNYSGNPAVRAQQQQQQARSRSASTQPPSESIPSLDSGNTAPASWLSSGNASHLAFQPPLRYPLQTFHKRNSSDSTVTSAGPNSPFTPVSLPHQPYIVDPESHSYLSPHTESFEQNQQSVTSYPKSLPPSSGAITDSLFFAPQFQNQAAQYGNQSQWENAMRQALFQHYPHLDGNGQHHNMAGNLGVSGGANGRLGVVDRNKVPSLDRTMSDVYQDELYNPEEPTVPAPTSKPATPTFKMEGNNVSPRNSIFSERLQAAKQGHITARSASPTTAVSREKSPFQPSSLYAGEGYAASASSGPRTGSAGQLREKHHAEAEVLAAAQHTQPHNTDPDQRTVSPKEVSLEYEPDNDSRASLFAEVQSPGRHNARSQRPSKLNQELTQPEQSFGSMADLKREGSSNLSTGSMSTRVSQTSQIPQQYPFISRSRQQTSGAQSSQDSIPEFPAHMVSMESTKSEVRSVHSESQSHSEDSDSEISRPANTQADTGTYTCTYHGCSQRFETPQKLQKHKREGHRQGTPSSGSESRNTQAGPHKCERLNPSTGKPCNSVFSRPYDLTRHEDTIHNARKQKVRCMVCQEEKTFSRSDALTRHMRVVHPEVEFPGKSKRGK